MTDTTRKTGEHMMAAMVVHILDLMSWSKLDTQRILDIAGITREELTPRNGRLPVSVTVRLLHAGLEVTHDPHLLMKLSKSTFTTGFGVLGYLAQSCPTLQDAMENMIRFGPLVSNIGYATIEHEPGLAVWTLIVNHDDPLLVRCANEYMLGVGYRFLLLVDAKRSEIVREVRFTHPAPETAEQRAAYAEVFNCPIQFNAQQNAIVLTAQALARPLRQPDGALKEVVRQQAELKLNELDDTPAFPAQVRKELEVLILSRQASRETLAERLGVSSRHLGRLLSNAGLSYRELVDELRMEIARNYLLKSARSMAEISEILGFQDSPSFSRWFRQETGMTPGDFRLQAQR